MFRFYWACQQVKMSFGCYPAVSLKQAREYRDEARRLRD
ncbi:Arm DNA-binding domain-containing protein [Pseudomonas azotoformans]